MTLRPLPSDFRPLTLDLPMTRGDREEEEGEEEGEGEGEEEQDEMCEGLSNKIQNLYLL